MEVGDRRYHPLPPLSSTPATVIEGNKVKDALKHSRATEAAEPKVGIKVCFGQKETLMSIEGKNPAAKHERSTGKRKAG
jgi:hypothetical protein